MVSTASENFNQENLLHLPLNPIGDHLHVEGATGLNLPYIGFIEVNLKIPDTECVEDVLLLAVSHTNYHSLVPVLIGTNIIHCFMPKLGQGAIPAAWEVAKRCVVVYEKHL